MSYYALAPFTEEPTMAVLIALWVSITIAVAILLWTLYISPVSKSVKLIYGGAVVFGWGFNIVLSMIIR